MVQRVVWIGISVITIIGTFCYLLPHVSNIQELHGFLCQNVTNFWIFHITCASSLSPIPLLAGVLERLYIDIVKPTRSQLQAQSLLTSRPYRVTKILAHNSQCVWVMRVMVICALLIVTTLVICSSEQVLFNVNFVITHANANFRFLAKDSPNYVQGVSKVCQNMNCYFDCWTKLSDIPQNNIFKNETDC